MTCRGEGGADGDAKKGIEKERSEVSACLALPVVILHVCMFFILRKKGKVSKQPGNAVSACSQ